MIDKERERLASAGNDLNNLSILLSQHDDEEESEIDDEEAYKNAMAKPLFNSGDADEEDPDA